jgi:multiple sugar transport system substrate-binding protein
MFISGRKKAATAALVAAAMFALGGCGSSGGSAVGSDGKVHITFWQQKFEDYQQAWFKKYVDKFNASQNKIKVDLQVVPPDTWDQKLKAAQAAGTEPDVATTNYGSIPAGVADGEFTDLDGLITASSIADIKDTVKPMVTVGGKVYAYPLLVEPSTVLYYRTDLVKAAGLDPNSPPKTWDQLITWATKLTKGSVKGISIASTAQDISWSSWGLQYDSCGHLALNNDWSKSLVTDPCFARVANFYKTLYQNKLMPAQPLVNYADATPYGQGQVAMMANGSWAVGQLKNTFPAMVAKTAVAPFPSWNGDPTNTTATLGGWTLTIDSKSRDKAADAQFIQYLAAGDPSIMADFFQTSGFSKFTVRKSVDALLASNPQAKSDPFMKTITDDVVPYGKREGDYPFEISLDLGTAIEASMKGTSSVTSALQAADGKINKVIQEQQLSGTEPQ